MNDKISTTPAQPRDPAEDSVDPVEDFDDWVERVGNVVSIPRNTPRGVLQARVRIGTLYFNVSAVEVTRDDEGFQQAADEGIRDWYRKLIDVCSAPTGSFQTAWFGGHQYAVFMYPRS